MKLCLNVTTYRNQPPVTPLSAVFDEQGGTLGRSAGNLFVLPDPERFISGKHAAIVFRDGSFFITDTSTNGIYVGGSEQPLGRSNSAPLGNGDHLQIGDYEIEIVLEGDAGAAVPAFGVDNPFAAPPPPPTAASPAVDAFFPESEADEERVDTTPTTNSLFSVPPEPVASPITGSERDDVPVENEFFQPPQAIPEDWDSLTEAPLSAPPPAAEPAPEPHPEPLPSTKPTAAPSVSAALQDQEALRLILEGAGIPQFDIPKDAAPETLRTLGALMREMVEGLMGVLRARAEIKSQFRMQLTTIRPVENNPLKFTVSVEEALSHLFKPDNTAYLSPMDAIREAVDDISAHQLAVMAGMQGALSAMLQRFEPEALERYFQQKGGRGLLESKNAWYWEQYGEKHKELLAEAEDNFQDLFGEEFARAYEDQIARLTRARRD
ncbi:MAG: type VI secretion system-associated FHA domain protein TagH [gamma proteobacterium endosymbiont of Lamellibrachia anaximandri]|nr:type VI secretion system-associated FHA domain protein TagH [gamma proteobacterium endosymbiont of Lamellibrachia anaximandri]MBL3532898.1 type VI secretion system-associated FHA domain protein TagH [gamma proteobacterium endosymbiont of Lamellibrachia anaximandri]